MAAIHELLRQVEDPALRKRLEQEIDRLTEHKKFGLVFEEHLPECMPLYGLPIKRGSTVARKGNIGDTYIALKVSDKEAVCRNKISGENETINLDDLVVTAEFGEPIFPTLTSIDKVENAPESSLWHTLIQADNYHALQLMEYLYEGKVDCIYIDPPYNSGAKDWKYNNDYVDGADAWRHSKWLSMMKKRLELAKRLLNPDDSVLIITIDEKEYLHLGCLLEELFPSGEMQMVTTVINAKGAVRDGKFSRVEEYIFIVTLGNAHVHPLQYNMLDTTSEDVVNEPKPVDWLGFRRREATSVRKARPNQFYPIYVENETGKIMSIGDRIDFDVPRESVAVPEGCTALWPLKPDGTEMLWGLTPDVAKKNLQKGYLRVNNWNSKKKTGTVQYLQGGVIAGIESGTVEVIDHNDDGSVVAQYKVGTDTISPKRVWNAPSHNAENYGTNLVKKFLGQRKFPFPKSLYAVEDILKFFVKDNKNALIVDFFAGSGTTLHAVNMLNSEDDGNRRCIMVTNNEVSEAEARVLRNKGFKPGDVQWEELGIAKYVTWPRTVCSIKGTDIEGNVVEGEYIGSNRSISNGFAANCEFFKLDFLDKDMVSLGTQFKEILPLLWMKAGAIGKRPNIETDEPDMLVLPKNHFAVLVRESAYATFVSEVRKYDSIDTVYFVTNSESAFHDMTADIGIDNTYQLYRDYIDNFVIGSRRTRS
ncbi:MAG: site-specific DNA-methyltransferase [Butyrivibrio sp.]|nr:site-specific DNA-methyltransferase [Butyrivibrio sp.]